MTFHGIFLLDIEVELAWGMLDLALNPEKMTEICQRARANFVEVLGLLEKYEIPVTWGVLGHLLVHRSETVSAAPFSKMPFNDFKNLNDEPAFYGKDITDKIVEHVKKTKIPHDIGCHSFSHQLFGDPNFSQAMAEAEVERCIYLFRQTYGITPQVFIFPKNDVGHLEVLRRNGFIAFRGPIPQSINYSETAKGAGNSVRKYASLASQFASFYLTIPPPVADPLEENGLINIPASMCFNKKPFMPLGVVVKKALKGIDRAAQQGKVFHLFTHEVNFGQLQEATAFIEGFEKILAYAKLRREKNELETTTIRKMTEACIKQEKIQGAN